MRHSVIRPEQKHQVAGCQGAGGGTGADAMPKPSERDETEVVAEAAVVKQWPVGVGGSWE